MSSVLLIILSSYYSQTLLLFLLTTLSLWCVAKPVRPGHFPAASPTNPLVMRSSDHPIAFSNVLFQNGPAAATQQQQQQQPLSHSTTQKMM